jgi:hypothetical protein
MPRFFFRVVFAGVVAVAGLSVQPTLAQKGPGGAAAAAPVGCGVVIEVKKNNVVFPPKQHCEQGGDFALVVQNHDSADHTVHISKTMKNSKGMPTVVLSRDVEVTAKAGGAGVDTTSIGTTVATAPYTYALTLDATTLDPDIDVAVPSGRPHEIRRRGAKEER